MEEEVASEVVGVEEDQVLITLVLADPQSFTYRLEEEVTDQEEGTDQEEVMAKVFTEFLIKLYFFLGGRL